MAPICGGVGKTLPDVPECPSLGTVTRPLLERGTAMIHQLRPRSTSRKTWPEDIVAEAASRRRTVRVGIDCEGYAARVQLGEDVHGWDATRITAAILKVAEVAHDRYIVLTDISGTSSLTADQVAAAEHELNF